ncbi:MAG: response regulator [Chitinispirillia bacterium]|nr:response regulator [Chitinispirillia bacterium]MCL2268699.1 response regulator [Chitinispirillia bacterium]
MKVLVLDDEKKQMDNIKEAFARKRMEADVCVSSNEFMDALCAPRFEAVYINAETWSKGRSIYDYFGAGQKLDGKPVVIYNAGEKFPPINSRTPTGQDRLLRQPSNFETALE